MASVFPKRTFWRSPDLPIYLILLGCLCIGISIVTHYGESYDESWHAGFSRASLAAYSTGVIPTGTDDKGPFTGMISILGAEGLLKGIPGWKFIDRWHFMNFLWFILGVYFFYRLCKRLVQPWPATAATLLFVSQPLIWGHAFINPKDIAFSGLFMGSIFLGLELADRIFPQKNKVGFFQSQNGFSLRSLLRQIPAVFLAIRKCWQESRFWIRCLLIGLMALAFGAITSYPQVVSLLKTAVEQAYAASPESGLGRLFSKFAENSIHLPVNLYINKAVSLYSKMVLKAEISLIGGMILVIAILLFPLIRQRSYGWVKSTGNMFSQFNWKRHIQNFSAFLNLAKKDWGTAPGWAHFLLIALVLLLVGVATIFFRIQAGLPAERATDPISMLPFWTTFLMAILVIIALIFAVRKVFSGLNNHKSGYELIAPVLLAACFLGFASDVRTIGPAAWILVSVYFLFKGAQKAIPAILGYTGVTALVTFLFWPKLWRDPLHTYLSMMAQSANYGWNSTTLFDGKLYMANGLPRSYLPTLFSLQLTEPALLMIFLGFVVAGLILLSRAKPSTDILIIGAWFFVPVVGAIFLRSPLYDNARQFLFVWPPLFILSSLAFQSIWDLVRRKFLFGLICLVLLVPGVYWIFQLHPYEYVYYNRLIGGVQGAFRKYELDYWATSYKEDVEFLNKVAPQSARIYLSGPNGIARTYRRSDMRTLLDPDEDKVPNYAVLLNRRDADLLKYPDSHVVYEVKRDHAILSVVKQVKPGEIVSRDPPPKP